MRICLLLLLCYLFGNQSTFGQLSPPGIDGAKAVSWTAVGINQAITKKWAINSYVGESRQSDPDNLSLLRKQAILVLNQETYWTIDSHWRLAFCTSFRLQNLYKHESPFKEDSPSLRDEIRYYTRLFYKHQIRKVILSYSFRPEYRTFYNSIQRPEHKYASELRLRMKVQISTPIRESKKYSAIIANELLTATDHYPIEDGANWSPYHFTENRFSTYLQYKFNNLPIVLDIGMMHQIFQKEGKLNYIPYLSLDLLFINPFSKKKQTVESFYQLK